MADIRWFASTPESEAVAQVQQTASMPFVKHVAVMPDVHYGKGSTVGTVIATQGAVMPACVGVDIGCGMIAVRTNLNVADVRAKAKEIREGIERRIPVGIGPYGMNNNIHPSAARRIAILEEHQAREGINMDVRFKDWRKQLGSLGGGNHFIEVCVGKEVARNPDGDVLAERIDNDEVWVILHSGSRAVGNKTGSHWTKVAQAQAKRYQYDQWLPNPDLAYLIEQSQEYHDYIKELKWCQMFALLNREEMMDRVLWELNCTVLGVKATVTNVPCDHMDGCLAPVVTFEKNPPIELERINCHHNFSKIENINGQNFLITRKGAIEAREGMRALIPGSMGARSYIVTGLGNPGSLFSAPHGAGRRMSRTKARANFTKEGLTELMQGLNIESRVREAVVDEHPGAYKDIDTVMEEAKELVRPTHVLSQIINVKGD